MLLFHGTHQIITAMPIPAAALFAGASAAGGALSAIGSFFGAKNQKTNARLNAEIARVNAHIADIQSRDAMAQGQRAEQASRLRTAQTKSSARAALAANGIDVGSEVATAINSSTDYVGEVDANTIAANAIKSAWGYKMDAVNQRAQAAMADANADTISPGLAAMTSLLGSATQAAPSWYQMKKLGG